MTTFGYAEMRDWAEQSDDPRVKAMWRRLEACRSKTAMWCEAMEYAELRSKNLAAEVERLGKQASFFRVYMDALDRSAFDMSPCRVCGEPVVCLPDGLALCEPCATRERIEQ